MSNSTLDTPRRRKGLERLKMDQVTTTLSKQDPGQHRVNLAGARRRKEAALNARPPLTGIASGIGSKPLSDASAKVASAIGNKIPRPQDAQ
jgi:hypothetical protein